MEEVMIVQVMEQVSRLVEVTVQGDIVQEGMEVERGIVQEEEGRISTRSILI
jgi:hypothetical protein